MRGIGRRTLRGAASVAALVAVGSVASGGVLANVDTTRFSPSSHVAPAATGDSPALPSGPQGGWKSAIRYPASYYRGPLGKRNPLPPRRGAFLLGWYGRTSIGWSGVKAGLLERHRDMGRTFDGIATAWVPSERREQWIHTQGALPIIAGWTPGGSPQQIASGERDRQIAAFAKRLKKYPFVVMVRIFHEFDMEHVTYHACGPTFVAMWRRVVSVMQQRGADNVGFWWSPSEGYNRACTTSSYPGDSYVDWVGSDSYNHCFVGEDCYATPYTPGWSEFGPIFDYEKSFANLTTQHDRFGPSKPFVIGETGTVYDEAHPSRKGDWYRNVVPAAKQMEHLRGVMFFDADASQVETARNNWHVDHPRSNPSVYQGFIAMARDPWFNTRG